MSSVDLPALIYSFNTSSICQNMETQKYIVLGFQLMKGGDLFKYLCDRGPSAADASLSEVEARHVFQQVVAGVSYAHNHSIVHRDLKLENILYVPCNEILYL